MSWQHARPSGSSKKSTSQRNGSGFNPRKVQEEFLAQKRINTVHGNRSVLGDRWKNARDRARFLKAIRKNTVFEKTASSVTKSTDTSEPWIPVSQKIKPTHVIYPEGWMFELKEKRGDVMFGFARLKFPGEKDEETPSFLQSGIADIKNPGLFTACSVKAVIFRGKKQKSMAVAVSASDDCAPPDLRRVLSE